MTVMIRMARAGRKNLPHFHIVAAQKTRARDGRFIEKIGHYSPLTKELVWSTERLEHWLSHGAQPSEKVAKLMIKEKVGSEALRSKFQKLFDRRAKIIAERKKAEEAKAKAEADAAAAEAAAAEAPAEEPAPAEAAAEAPAEEAPAEEVKAEASDSENADEKAAS